MTGYLLADTEGQPLLILEAAAGTDATLYSQRNRMPAGWASRFSLRTREMRRPFRPLPRGWRAVQLSS